MTHFRRSEKVYMMKRLLLIFALTLIFQTSAKTSEIKDFELEGMSVGKSLLEYFSEEKILKELNSEYAYMYTVIFFMISCIM